MALMVSACTTVPSGPSTPDILRHQVNKPFHEVVFDLEFAISERNFRITGRNLIGEGLQKRGYTAFPKARVIHFCNLELAREVLKLDIGFIAHMPCRISIYEWDGETVIAANLLPEDHVDHQVNKFAKRNNMLLREIVLAAAETQ